MCRFTFYLGAPIRLGSLITEPTHSLIKQSFDSKERSEPLNGDGFGVAWYANNHDEAAVFRSITPAWNNGNLEDLSRVTTSGCVVAHVRAATQGLGVTEFNCHPFKSGNLTFCHNGDIGGFEKIRRPLVNLLSDEAFSSIKGSTDSEHLFALILDQLRKQTNTESNAESTDAMANAMQDAVDIVNNLAQEHAPGHHCYLNMVLTNGQEAVVCRYTSDQDDKASSLYINQGKRYVCEDGVCSMLGDSKDNAVIISSEPLSADNSWQQVPVGHMLLINKNLAVTERAFQFALR